MESEGTRIDALGMREDQGLNARDARHAMLIENMDHDPEGFWRPAMGMVQVGSWTAGTGALLGLQWFEPRPGQRWLVFEREISDSRSELRYVSRWPTFTTSLIQNRRRVTNGPGGQWLEFGRWLYHLNGLEQPIRWDGERVSPMGFAQAPPPPIAVGLNGWDKHDVAGLVTWPTTWNDTAKTNQRGVGEYPPPTGASPADDTPWRMGYALVYVNDLGQRSPASAICWVSGVNVAGAAAGIYRTTVRVAVEQAPAHIRAVILLRTRNLWNVTGTDIDSAAELYELETFSTAGGFDYVDMTPDAELGVLHDPDAVGPVPLNPSAGVVWQNTMWLAAEGVLYHSSPLFLEQFPVNNRIPVATTSSGDIMALYPIPRGLLVYCERATFIVKGNPVEGYVLEQLSSTVGLVARAALAGIPGVGLAWLAESGPHILLGILEGDEPTRVQPIDGIRKTWRRVAGRQPRTAFAMHDPELQHVWWHIPEGGNVLPTYGLVWHYDFGGWSTRPTAAWRMAAAQRYHGRWWIASHDDSGDNTAGVHVLTRGSDLRMGVETTSSYTTGQIAGGKRTLLQSVWIHAIGMGDTTLDVTYRKDRATSFVEVARTDRRLQAAEQSRDRWGTALWGAAYSWGDHEPVTVKLSVYDANAYEHQFKLVGARLRLVAVEPHVAPRGGPLDTPWLER